ncbi:MAG TPA: GNAT family N-acetyltransferase [Thermodesulfobacteriota bacterium]|nr:GNAT family N-acetyltransferase [Thermodesulfobacteriota bacterium]
MKDTGIDLSEYPKGFMLKDGKGVILRPLTKEDGEALLEFFSNLPEEDRLFLKHNVTDKDLVHSWVNNINYEKVLPIVVQMGYKIIGEATLHMKKHGWFKDVGEIRLAIDQRYRRQRLGCRLVCEIIHLAIKLGLRKIIAQVAADQEYEIRLLELLGFRAEALLDDMLTDLKGNKRDLIIMVHDIDTIWRKTQTYGIFDLMTSIREML